MFGVNMGFKRLNLGSGGEYKEGWVNLDVDPYFKPDIIHDLDNFPYPFADSSFDEVRIVSVFEHLKEPVKVLEEIYRISKDKALVDIRVPYFKHPWVAWSDITHLRAYSGMAFNQLKNRGYSRFNFNFKLLEIKYRVIINRNWLKPFIYFSNWLINLNPTLTEYVWSRYIPIQQVGWILEVKKNGKNKRREGKGN